MKTGFAIVASALLATAVPGLAQQQQVRVTGNSNAGEVLIKDILSNIFLYSKAADGCEQMGEVKPKVLADYEPKDPAYRVGESSVTYERWDVMLCGKRKTFLVSYWPVESGGSLFAIGYPPPADLPE